jgi:hypothetical protein
MDVIPDTYVVRVTVTDGALSRYVDVTITVTKEDATVDYTGDTIGFTGTNLTLEATVRDSAAAGYVAGASNTGPAGDTTKGDITKMWIRFDIFTQANCGSVTPTATKWAQVSDGAVAADGIGTAQAFYTSSTEGTYCVTSTLVANNGSATTDLNPWYQADPDNGDATLTFYSNSGKFVTGGGWIVDPDTTKHGNFGFNARFTKSGTPQGQVVYVYRANYTGPCTIGKTITTCTNVPATYVIKSNSITALGFINFGTNQYPWPIQSRIQGKATIQINRASDGLLLWSEGNASFDSTVTDSGESSGIDADDFAITVIRNGATSPYKFAPKTLLKGGNIVIHLQ